MVWQRPRKRKREEEKLESINEHFDGILTPSHGVIFNKLVTQTKEYCVGFDPY